MKKLSIVGIFFLTLFVVLGTSGSAYAAKPTPSPTPTPTVAPTITPSVTPEPPGLGCDPSGEYCFGG